MVDVCMVTDYWPGMHDIWGGAERICQRFCRLLQQSGLRVAVVSTRPKNGGAVIDDEGEFYAVPVAGDFWGARLGYYFENVKWLGLPYDPVALAAGYRLLRRLRPRLLWLQNHKALSLGWVRLAKALGIPVAYSIYDYWCICPNQVLRRNGRIGSEAVCSSYHGTWCVECMEVAKHRHGRIQAGLLRLRRPVFGRLLGLVDAFVVLSQASREIMVRYGVPPERVWVIPQPFWLPEDAEMKEDGESWPCSVLFVGWLDRSKGAHVLLEAAGLLRQRYPELKVYLVGRPYIAEYYARLKEMVVREGLVGYVEFLGRVAEAELKRLLAFCQVVAVPEQWANMSPAFLIEAMAQGKPVVASRIGGLAEFVEHGVSGFLAHPEKPEEFAEYMAWVFDQPQAAEAMGRRARERVRRLCDREVIRERLVKLYTQFAA